MMTPELEAKLKAYLASLPKGVRCKFVGKDKKTGAPLYKQLHRNQQVSVSPFPGARNVKYAERMARMRMSREERIALRDQKNPNNQQRKQEK